MKTKIFTLIFLTAILAVSFVSFASADVDFLDADNTALTELSATVNQGEQATLSFYLEEASYGNMTDIEITSPLTLDSGSNSFDVALTDDAPTTLDKDEKSGLVTVTFNIPETQATGVYYGELEVVGQYAGASSSTIDVKITVTQPPMPSEVIAVRALPNPNDDLVVEIEDINVISGFGEDEEWLALDEVEVEINIENNNDDEEIEDIVIGWGLYDEDADKWYIDDEEDDFDLDEDEEEKITISFKLDEDIEELDDYDKFYVWATAVDYNDNEIGTYAVEDISIQDESDFVVAYDIKVVESAECGMDVQVVADIWNIGSDDQEEVSVVIVEPDLGIYQKIEIGDIDAYDDEKLDVTIQVPEDAEEGSYFVKIKVYDEDDDLYENDYDDDEAEFIFPLKIEGNCLVAPKATITATLDSDAKSGKELTVKSVITNDDDEQTTFTLEAADYTTWATLKSISPQVTVLEAGESAEVIYKFNVKDDIEGAQSFNMVVKTGNTEKQTMKQPVSVTIEKYEGWSFPGFTGNVVEGDNYWLWGIGLLNVVLIVIIIAVAVRVARS